MFLLAPIREERIIMIEGITKSLWFKRPNKASGEAQSSLLILLTPETYATATECTKINKIISIISICKYVSLSKGKLNATGIKTIDTIIVREVGEVLIFIPARKVREV
ncbi:hypothetical protein IPA_02260 [Ignicoccus pacificus DSM 13166]|uniref:Uncharacterized protein n=1 Tax=Ignicoccus pacificus DSM 13166 TaxID=940294 RepID=A0A977KC60_9CREN|nr:hypothetical protein IPA_02260 [Ignicoccus pacificus DSM 13166]